MLAPQGEDFVKVMASGASGRTPAICIKIPSHLGWQGFAHIARLSPLAIGSGLSAGSFAVSEILTTGNNGRVFRGKREGEFRNYIESILA